MSEDRIPNIDNLREYVVDEPESINDYHKTINYNGEERGYLFKDEVDGKEEKLAGEWVRKLFHRDDDYMYLGKYSSNLDLEPNIARVKTDAINHMGTFSETGGGKSTFYQNQMVNLASRGYGFCYIDPKKAERDENGIPMSDAVDLIRKIPPHRYDDIVYITPDTIDGYSYSFNPLELPEGYDVDDEDAESILNFQKNFMKNLMDVALPDAYWGPQMGNIFESLTNIMMRSETEYQMGDLQYSIQNPDVIESIIERFEQESDDDVEKDILSSISDLNDDEYNSLRRRTNQFVYNHDVRDIIFGKESNIDFREIVEDGKIVIVDINKEVSSGLNVRKILMGYLINMLYIAATSVRNKRDYFLYCDEFDIVLNNDLVPIIPILKRGRSQNFVLSMSTQTPTTLDTEGAIKDANVLDESRTNVNLVSTGQLDEREAKVIETMYSSNEPIGADTISSAGKFNFWIQPPDSKHGNALATEVEAFPPYPPRISRDRVRDIIRNSVMEYGVPYRDSLSYEENVHDHLRESSSAFSIEDGMSIIDVAMMYDSAHKDLPDRYATSQTIKKIASAAELADLDDFNLEQWLENQTGRGLLEADKSADDVLYKLTEHGRDKIELGTGESGSAGGQEHRIVTQKIRKTLAEKGVFVTLPEQGGSDTEADAHGAVFDDVENRPLKNRVDVGDSFVIEIEKSTTDDRPSRMLKNLQKAFTQDEFVLFVTDERPPEKSSKPERYEKIEQIIEEQEFVRDNTEHRKRLYNGRTMGKDGMYPLRKLPDTSQKNTRASKWFLKNEELHLMERDETGDMVSVASWSPASDFADWSIEEFPAYAERNSSGKYVVHDIEEEKTLDPVDDVNKNTRKYRTVNEPWIPELKLGGEYPDQSEYDILVLPTRGRSLDEPKLYQNGQLYDFGEEPPKQETEDETTDEEMREFF